MIGRVSSIELPALRNALRTWYGAEERSVAFNERIVHDDMDDADSYRVVYEARFHSESLNVATVELWLTEDGGVAIGFERRERVARALGTRAYQPHRFAAGHEPRDLSIAAVLDVLTAIAHGRVGLEAMALPLFGIVSTRAVLNRGSEGRGTPWESHPDWIISPATASSWWRRIFYRPWQSSPARPMSVSDAS